MKETGLMFKAPLVRAILEGRKTQTRRVAPKQSGCPYGEPGDRIYVRETFAPYERDCFYRADSGSTAMGPWKPAIHMPKELARIWLEVTGVRVERLQDISEKDAIAEGIERTEDFFGCPCWRDYSEPEGPDASVCPDDPIGSFQTLWESTGGDWAANPWVWVVDFKVLSTTGRPA